MRIAFIGLGTMGKPMAMHLQRAGHTLAVYNRNRDRARDFEGLESVTVVSTPKEAAGQADIVFTMLTDDAVVEAVYLGEDGILSACMDEASGTPKIVVDCSTIYPDTTTMLAERLAAVGVDMLDAPVSGSEPHAIEGILTFIVGGKKEAYEICLPLFELMGRKALYMGPNGTGANAKLANNLIVAANITALAEGMSIVQKSGGNPELFLEILAGGGARSAAAEVKGPRILNRDFSPQFMAQLMFKDIKLAGRLAQSLQVPTPIQATVQQLFQITCNSGLGQEDLSAVAKTYESWIGETIGENLEKK